MNFKFFFCMFLSLFILTAQASPGALDNKIITIKGTSSKYGSYQGEIELRETAGTIKAIRIITYDSFQFENLAVQEVWTGSALYDASGDFYLITYDLKQADFLKTANGLSRSDENFKNKTRVVQKISASNNLIPGESFFRHDEVFNESTFESREQESTPLWENLRYRVESVDHENSTLIHIAGDFMDWRLSRWFHNQPFALQYSDREDYKNKKQFVIYDPTDYDFYQNNPDKIRVINKEPDPISLIEDLQRRNAYAPSLEEKMKHFEDDMQSNHLNEYGLFSGAQFSADGNFVKYLMDGDASLWTGMYLGAQAMRYKLTNDQTALENLKKALSGLMLLMDITESSTEFARSVGKYEEGTVLTDRIHRGNNQHADKIWLSTGNNDMFKGLIHGFIWSYMTLPESETSLRADLLNHMIRLPDLTVAKKIQNKASAFGLKALATKSEKDRQSFIKNFLLIHTGEAILNIEGDLHLGGIVDWSGINLGMVSNLNDLLIAKALNEDSIVFKAKQDLLYAWKDLAGTKRDFLTVAAHAFAMKDGFNLAAINEFNDRYSLIDLRKTWNYELRNSIWSLREIPINRSNYDTAYNYSLRPEWCLAWWPKLPWKSLLKRNPPEYHYQGVDSYPLFEGLGLGNNFIWKAHAFQYQGGSNKMMRVAGADYLYTYWMARFSGLIK